MRRGRIIAGLLVLLTVLAGVNPSPAKIGRKFCQNRAEVVGYGSQSQLRIHYDLFIPEYEARCPKAAGGLVYFGANEEEVVKRMLYRGLEGSSDHFWTRDSSLSDTDKIQIERDAAALRGRGSPIGHFPMYVQGLAVAYNLTCVKKPLRLSARTLSMMYAGTIDRWNDPAIVNEQEDPAVRSQLENCLRTIRLTGRADSAGETVTFKSYLARRNPAFTPYAQSDLNTQWPAPLVCRGGGDVGAAGCVASNTGSIGYVSIKRAAAMGLQTAHVERLRIQRGVIDALDANAQDPVPTVDELTRVPDAKIDYVAPNLSGCTEAAASLQFPPGFDNYSSWTPVSLVDANAGYPLCYFSYLIMFQRQSGAYAGNGVDPDMSAMLRDYMLTILTPKVQKGLAKRGLAPLPSNVINLNRIGVDRIENPECPLPVYVPEGTPISRDPNFVDESGCTGLYIFRGGS